MWRVSILSLFRARQLYCMESASTDTFRDSCRGQEKDTACPPWLLKVMLIFRIIITTLNCASHK